jgi:signal transduction histidine kinase
MERLISDLFELSRLESGSLQLDLMPVNLHELLSEIVGSLAPQAEAHGLRLTLEDASLAGLVRVDPGQLQRVVANLVQNAMRHTPAGGQIVVSAQASDDQVRVQVTDTGEGIATEDLPHVFDRFYRGEKSRARHTGGAGLGLAISKAIVEAHRGRIWAENQPPRGARVVFTLPMA